MAATFTGLKLQGELGRFGTTELSDIAGNYVFHISHICYFERSKFTVNSRTIQA